MLDRLTSMAVFVQAAESGSFASTAAALGMSAQMVANHVTALEKHLATRLLNRTTRRQSLTEFGQVYLERCKAVLAEVDAADALAQATHAEPRGRLRVSAPVTFGRHTLVPLVTRFLRQYPEVQLDLELSDQPADLIRDGFEAIFRIGQLDEELAWVARPLRAYRLIACASSAYIAERGAPREPSDLARYECIGFTPWMALANGRRLTFSRNGRDYEVNVTSRLSLSDWGAMRSAALGGFGVLIGQEYALEEDLAAGRLLRVLPEYSGSVRPLHILYASDQRMTSKLRYFVDMVVAELGA